MSILALACLVAPVAADKYVVTSSSSSPVAGADVTISAQLSTDDGVAIATADKVVTWSKTGTGGSFLAATSITNAAGIATVTFTTGTTAGTAYTVTGTDGDSATGTSTAITTVAGAATQIAKNAGDTQSATVGTAVATPPSVIVKDANNNPVSGISVTFAVATGGGVVSGGSATTGANGIASVGGWTLGTTAGANTLTATSSGLTGSPLSFTATGTAAASAPTITTLTPASGINNGYIQGVDIAGTGFASLATVRLVKSGQSNITIVNPNITSTHIVGDFNLNGVTAGAWDVVVINTDGGTATKSSGFTVVNATAATVTSVSPASATTNTTVSTTIAGTGFQTTAKMRLTRSGYNPILGLVTSTATSTSIAGTFNLTNQAPGTWTACVLYDGTTSVCGPTFTISAMPTGVNGSIYFTSSPSGATVWVDSVEKGTTPFTLSEVTPGFYNIKIQRTSYLDWADRVEVTAGNETTVSATLTYQAAATTATPVPTTIFVSTATLPPTTVKSSLAAPTPWPSDTPAPESPVGILVIVGALATGVIVLRRQ